MLDKSGNGYHATQSITASRPTLSARKNILLATEALATQSVTTLAAQYTLSFTGTGSVTLSGTATGTLTGNGTDRVSLTFTPTAGTLTLTVSGSVTKAQLELGAVAGQYQRVATATDYDVSAHYYYLRFDGVDDYLNLPWMNLAGSNLGTTTIATMDSRASSRDVSYVISEKTTYIPVTVYGPIYLAYGLSHRVFMMKDNISLLDTGYGVQADRANVFSVTDDLINITQRKNGAITNQVAFTHPAMVTNQTLIGASNHGGVVGGYLAGNLYGMIITKSALTDSQRVACERYLGRKSGVTL